DEFGIFRPFCFSVSMREPLSDIYWLNVADPGYDFGGVIEQTNFVGPENYGGKHIAYFSRYIDADNSLWTAPDEQLTERFLRQAERLYGRSLKSAVLKTWVFRGRYASPRPELGFHRLIPKFRSPIPGLFVASMCHVYPDERSVNNSVRVAAEVVRALGDDAAANAVPRNLSLSAKYGW